MTTDHGNITRYHDALWKLPTLVKYFTDHFPNVNMTSTHVLVTGPAPFQVQEIQCLFATSGRCSPTFRAMFYALSIVSLFLGKEIWIASVTMAYVMIYSTVAAFHAIVMVSIRQRLASRPFEFVSIATAGLVEAPQLPIWPMTWDEDCDGVLAIVGTAFLIMAPMVIWSGPFHDAWDKNAINRPIFVGWFLLLLVGLICAFVNEVYVDLWTVGQFRFCSPGNLPDLSLSSFSLLGREQPNVSFNESIWNIFSNVSTSPELPATRVHPCFDVSWPLRQRSSIKVISASGTWPSTSNYPNVNIGWSLMFTAILLIAASVSITVTIFVLKKRYGFTYSDRGRLDIDDTVNIATRRWLWRFDYGAKILTGISFFFFMAWIEYTMWPYPYAEMFAFIGQWGQLIATLPVLAFAVYKYIFDPEQEPLAVDGQTPAVNGQTSAANRQISAANGHSPAENARLLAN